MSRWRAGQRGGGPRESKKAGPPSTTTWRNCTVDAPNRLWLTDITEHCTGEGNLYLCAVKDVYSNRIVGYSIDGRMKSRIAVARSTTPSQ